MKTILYQVVPSVKEGGIYPTWIVNHVTHGSVTVSLFGLTKCSSESRQFVLQEENMTLNWAERSVIRQQLDDVDAEEAEYWASIRLFILYFTERHPFMDPHGPKFVPFNTRKRCSMYQIH